MIEDLFKTILINKLNFFPSEAEIDWRVASGQPPEVWKRPKHDCVPSKFKKKADSLGTDT